jgi:pimeloyl-ACP methyl ester carboxylesterase
MHLWGLAAALVGAPAVQLAYLRHRLAERHCAGERHSITTPDGARLALYRYAPTEPVPGREPVLMISGFGLNRQAIDYDARYSWARRYAEAGFDTWVLEVRGSGLSKRAGWRDGSFDDYVVDARTALQHILEATGAEKLHWVGYSLGGMLLYAAIGQVEGARVRSGVAIESPVSLKNYPLDASSHRALDLLDRVPALHAIPYKLASRLAMPLLPLCYEGPMYGTWMNLANMDRSLLPGIVYRTLDDVPSPLVLQFRVWMTRETLTTMDGRHDYLAGLADCRVPLLVVTGQSDFARRARGVFDRLEGAEAPIEWVECLESKGFAADYGHADLIFGQRAPEEVLPYALGWTRRHDPAGNLAITK